MFLSTCENIWLQRLVLHQCPHVLFPFHFFLIEEMLLAMVKKTMDHDVLLNLTFATIVLLVLTYEMSHIDVDTFTLLINFLNDNWVPMHVIVKLFGVNETTR
jgi:hypothetical protein